MTRRAAYGIVVAFAIALVATAYYVSIVTPAVVDATVSLKVIYGVKVIDGRDTNWILVLMQCWSVEVVDHALDGLFQGMDCNATIDATLKSQILSSGYSEIHYGVDVTLISEDEANDLDPGARMLYIVEKMDDFNTLRLGGTHEFEVNKGVAATGEPPHITRVRD